MVLIVTLQVKLFFILTDAESLVHYGACGGVLDVNLPVRFDPLLDREGGQRRLMKTTENKFLLARIMIDIADRVDAGR